MKKNGYINKQALFLMLALFSIAMILIPLFVLNLGPQNLSSSLLNPQKEKIKLVGAPINNNFQATQSPQIKIKTALSAEELKKRIIFRDSQKNPVNLDFEIKEEREIKTITIIPTPEFKPGKYTLELEKVTGINFTQDFTWGVLAINTNKSSYLPGEEAEIYMTVLDNAGRTACYADINLTITSPKGKKIQFTTSDGSITRSPECQPKNFTYQPDFKVIFKAPQEEGNYQLYLESKINDQTRQISSILLVSQNQSFVISRSGPTRLYPPSTYEMKIKIKPNQDFSGIVQEKVPASFKISETTASEHLEGGVAPAAHLPGEKTTSEVKILSWQADLKKGEETTFSYKFKAPNISPEFYLLGPLALYPRQSATNQRSSAVFAEQRQWQLASDATAHLIVLYDGGSTPTGWTCISCSGGDDFYQVFVRGNDDYGVATGGNASHSHSFTGTQTGCTCPACVSSSGTVIFNAANCSHTHTVTSGDTGNGANTPSYRELKLIKHDIGIPASIPASSIAIFDAAVSGDFSRYSSEDNYFIRGSGSAGTTGGNNSHAHSITYTIATATSNYGRPLTGSTSTLLNDNNHVHANGSATTGSISNEPPYTTVILGQVSGTASVPLNMLAMFDTTPNSGWSVKSDSGDTFHEQFLVGNSSYGTTGGAATHTHANATGTTLGYQADGNISITTTGTTYCNPIGNFHTHTHSLTIASATHLPVYRDIIIAKLTDFGSPINCYASENASHNLVVYWTDDSALISDSFQIYRSVDGGEYSSLGTAAAGATSYTDDTVQDGHTYSYEIRSVLGTNYSNWCTASTFSYHFGLKFEGIKMEGIKIGH